MHAFLIVPMHVRPIIPDLIIFINFTIALTFGFKFPTELKGPLRN